jgi:hypothetical protein
MGRSPVAAIMNFVTVAVPTFSIILYFYIQVLREVGMLRSLELERCNAGFKRIFDRGRNNEVSWPMISCGVRWRVSWMGRNVPLYRSS